MLGLKVTSPIDTLDRQTYPHLSSPLSSIPLSRPSIQPFSIYSYHITSSPVLPSLPCPALSCPALPILQSNVSGSGGALGIGMGNIIGVSHVVSLFTSDHPLLSSLFHSLPIYLHRSSPFIPLSSPTLPYLTLPYLILLYLTLFYPTSPYLTIPYLTSPHLCFYRQYDVIYFSRSPLLSLKLIFSLLTDLPSISISISNFFSVISR